MIAGLQKMTLLDFPGRVACTVFLQGCNFRCPFCHNSDLLPHEGEELMTQEAFLAFLRGRVGLLDGVCITGGEPTLQPGLVDLIREMKSLGYAVKLDTNGSRPTVLRALVEEGLLDYVAMDIKNAPSAYGETVGVEKLSLAPVEESIRYLLEDRVPYEFRTTLVAQFHTEERICEMGAWLTSLTPGAKPRRLFLQSFVDRDSVVFSGLSAPDADTVLHFASVLAPYVDEVTVRNS